MTTRVTLQGWLEGTWDEVRGYLRDDLDHLVSAVNRVLGGVVAATLTSIFTGTHGITTSDSVVTHRGYATIANGQSSVTVTFPSAFETASRVVVVLASQSLTEAVKVSALSTTGCTLTRAGTTGANSLMWLAIGPPSVV